MLLISSSQSHQMLRLDEVINEPIPLASRMSQMSDVRSVGFAGSQQLEMIFMPVKRTPSKLSQKRVSAFPKKPEKEEASQSMMGPAARYDVQ